MVWLSYIICDHPAIKIGVLYLNQFFKYTSGKQTKFSETAKFRMRDIIFVKSPFYFFYFQVGPFCLAAHP